MIISQIAQRTCNQSNTPSLSRSGALCGLRAICDYMVPYFFFFSSRRRHTRFDCDWSSDVCSSDLVARDFDGPLFGGALDFLQPLRMRHRADVPDVVEDVARVANQKRGKLAVVIPDRKSVV